jgi:UDP-N-acetylmuramoylalanine-D-glutamate ligase
LSPGVSITKSKNKHKLIKYKKKIITDLDLVYLLKKFNKSIVVTGTNGKSTTCKILAHLLKKNKFKVLLGGNIGTPILDLKIKKNNFLVIEASSFQLAYSKFVSPDYAFLLNITNDHIDWHGSMKNYIDAKLNIFRNQEKDQFSFLNKKFKSHFKKRNFLGKLIIPRIKRYKKIKPFLRNTYLKLNINDENMSHIFALANLLKITNKSFLNSLNSFKGLPHRYEIFLRRKNCIFINDSKATTFEATKFGIKVYKKYLFGF